MFFIFVVFAIYICRLVKTAQKSTVKYDYNDEKNTGC